MSRCPQITRLKARALQQIHEQHHPILTPTAPNLHHHDTSFSYYLPLSCMPCSLCRSMLQPVILRALLCRRYQGHALVRLWQVQCLWGQLQRRFVVYTNIVPSANDYGPRLSNAPPRSLGAKMHQQLSKGSAPCPQPTSSRLLIKTGVGI
jgi:hypothetical protein